MSAVFVTPSGPPTLPVPPAPKPTVEPFDPVDAMRAARSTEPADVVAMAVTDAAIAMGSVHLLAVAAKGCGCLLGDDCPCAGWVPRYDVAEAALVLSRPVRWSS